MCHPLVRGHWLPKALGFRYSASTMGLLHAPLVSPTEASQSAFPGWIIDPIGWIRLGEAKSCPKPTSKSVPEVGIEIQSSQPYCGNWMAFSEGLPRTAEATGQALFAWELWQMKGTGPCGGGAPQSQQHSRKQLRTRIPPEVYQWHSLGKQGHQY